jgi:uncharacterized membrane protein YphA (DoxX/SURF4 family)
MQTTTSTPSWTRAERIFFRFGASFLLLFILTLSFAHPYIPDIPGWVSPLFERTAQWIGEHIFHIKGHPAYKLIPDSTGLYIHLLQLLVLSFLSCMIWSFMDKRRKNYDQLQYWFIVVVSYYLSLQLLVYGFDKIFKRQFYLPEPNILFTTVGNTYPDTLYWSTMGISRSYSMFLGISELVAAVLLLFRRSRLAGALLSFSIMVNVVAVNFSFNIDVKIYSCFLLLLSIAVAWPDAGRLFRFLFVQKPVAEKIPGPYDYKKGKLFGWAKAIIIGYMFFSVLSIYTKAHDFNDDNFRRPVFHGAYDIPLFIRNSDTLPPLITDAYRWRRLFIHRRGYLIAQFMNDEMKDYTFSADTINHEWHIVPEAYNIPSVFSYVQLGDSTILLSGIVEGDTLQMQLNKIDWRSLPVLQHEFNWTIDE